MPFLDQTAFPATAFPLTEKFFYIFIKIFFFWVHFPFSPCNRENVSKRERRNDREHTGLTGGFRKENEKMLYLRKELNL